MRDGRAIVQRDRAQLGESVLARPLDRLVEHRDEHVQALDQCEPAFEQYRRDLDDADLSPRLEALYHLEAGKAYDIFGNAEAARESVERAIETAERNQFHQIAFQAAECLKQLLRGKRHVPQPAAFENAELEPVAVALKEMRVAAGVG